MELSLEKFGSKRLLVNVSGRIDLDSAVEFGTKIRDSIDNIEELIIDFRDVTFISSFGLKVILELYKHMKTKGSLKLRNVSDSIKESFVMVGFDRFLTIE